MESLFSTCKDPSCQGHKKPQEQRLKQRFKSNFPTRKQGNKIRLCDSKTKTQKLRIRTWDVQDKCDNRFLLC